MDERTRVLLRLQAEPESEIVQETKARLSGEDARLLTEREAQLTVNEAMHLWRVRMRIGLDRGRPLLGAESLIATLQGLTPQKKLEQKVFTGKDWAGNLFFEKTSGRFLGAVLTQSDGSGLVR